MKNVCKQGCQFFGHDIPHDRCRPPPRPTASPNQAVEAYMNEQERAYTASKTGIVFPDPGPARDLGCKLPPPGWYCSRHPGHPGPCAAYPSPKRPIRPAYLTPDIIAEGDITYYTRANSLRPRLTLRGRLGLWLMALSSWVSGTSSGGPR